MTMSRHLTVVLLCTAMLLLNGCASTGPTRFYLLSPIGGDHAGGCPDGRTLSLGVGPIEVPRYLDRPQIMTRTGPNEMALAEFDLWAEPLKEGIPRILAGICRHRPAQGSRPMPGRDRTGSITCSLR